MPAWSAKNSTETKSQPAVTEKQLSTQTEVSSPDSQLQADLQQLVDCYFEQHKLEHKQQLADCANSAERDRLRYTRSWQRTFLEQNLGDKLFKEEVLSDFKEINQSGNGYISADELATWASDKSVQLGYDAAGKSLTERAEHIVQCADMDDDGRLSFNEFLLERAMKKWQDLGLDQRPATTQTEQPKACKESMPGQYQAVLHQLKRRLWISRERHIRATNYYLKQYRIFTGAQVVISALVSFASALWPEGKSIGGVSTGKILVTAGSTLTTMLISFSNMLELQSRKDTHSQASKLFHTLITDLEFTLSWPNEIEKVQKPGAASADSFDHLLAYLKNTRDKVVELEANLPAVPLHIMAEVEQAEARRQARMLDGHTGELSRTSTAPSDLEAAAPRQDSSGSVLTFVAAGSIGAVVLVCLWWWAAPFISEEQGGSRFQIVVVALLVLFFFGLSSWWCFRQRDTPYDNLGQPFNSS